MSAATIAIIVVVAVVLLVVSAMTITRRRLQQRFGPEYDRVAGEKGSQFRAAAELARRERRVQRLKIRPLSAAARAEYTADWKAVQERFVDQPNLAVAEGQDLLASVMRERGYPAEDPGQIAADLSVAHASTLDHYRAARQISAAAERGDASTEELRQALIHLRAVFADLLGEPGAVQAQGAEAPAELPRAEPSALDGTPARVPTAATAPNSGAAVPNSAAAVPNGGAALPDGGAALPDGGAALPDGGAALPDGGAAVPDGGAAVPDGGAAVPDGGAAVPDGGAAVPDGAGAVPDGAGAAARNAEAPAPEEQLWRPVRVPRARTSEADEETQ
jgi:hypothetical protein